MRRIVFSFLTLFLAPACGDSTGPEPAPVTVDVPNFLRFMEAGESFRFVAVVKRTSGKVFWASSNPAAVTIDQTGLAVAHAPGSSELSARFGTAGFSWLLTVVRPIAALTIEPAGVELVPGDKVQLMVVPADATGAPVTDSGADGYELAAAAVWSVADLTVARAEDAQQPALLTVLREGQTTVGAELLGHDASTTVAGRLFDAVDLAAGGAFGCALPTDSLPYCWGAGTELLGSPGTGWWTPAFIPHRAGTGPPLGFVSAGGRHACGLAEDGRAYCWGSNEFGALGIGTPDQPAGPVEVAGGLRFTMLTAGGIHTCGIATDGRTFCWGARHGVTIAEGPETCGPGGKVGIVFACSRAPLQLGDGTHRFGSLAAGGRHTCGLDAQGQAFCWGTWGSRWEPLPVAVGGPAFTALTSGDGYSCGLAAQGEAWCWGVNGEGQLGDGTTTPRDDPAPVSGGLGFESLSAGLTEVRTTDEGHVCGLTPAGEAWCWGRNLSGELGSPAGPPHPIPSPVSGGIVFRALRAGGSHTCGLSANSVLVCWGANYSGQLGIAGISGSDTPVVVSGQRGQSP